MDNPCLEINTFKDFGYPSEEPCWMCGAKPARSEPRFGYLACKDCKDYNPIRFNDAPFRPKGC